jgi:hypothetical protein
MCIAPASAHGRGDRSETLGRVSKVDRNSVSVTDALEKLTPEDRAWLEERLTEYREQLLYLHDH